MKSETLGFVSSLHRLITHPILFAACRPGYFLKKGKCRLCDVNTYSDQPHNTACTSCPDGTNNEDSEIRNSVSTCEEICECHEESSIGWMSL